MYRFCSSLTESMPMRGRGSRSTTRLQMTEELFAAHRSGRVRAVSVRASDLFGPHVTESLVGERLFAPLLAGKSTQIIANLDLPHSVSFIRDVGKALVTVGQHDTALGRAWHAPNAPAVTLREFIRILGEKANITPRISAPPKPVTRLLLPVLGLFVPPLRGLQENLYISYEPYIVDHSAYLQAFGGEATPLHDAISQTVQVPPVASPLGADVGEARPPPEGVGRTISGQPERLSCPCYHGRSSAPISNRFWTRAWPSMSRSPMAARTWALPMAGEVDWRCRSGVVRLASRGLVIRE